MRRISGFGTREIRPMVLIVIIKSSIPNSGPHIPQHMSVRHHHLLSGSSTNTVPVRRLHELHFRSYRHQGSFLTVKTSYPLVGERFDPLISAPLCKLPRSSFQWRFRIREPYVSRLASSVGRRDEIRRLSACRIIRIVPDIDRNVSA